MNIDLHSPRISRFGQAAIVPALFLVCVAAACTTSKDLPSDAPFDHGRYNPNPNPSYAGRSNADLVPSPTPVPTAAEKRTFTFDANCIDPDSGRTYSQNDPEFNGCMQKKQMKKP